MQEMISPLTYSDQPVFVGAGVNGPTAQIVQLDVLEDVQHERFGFVWVNERQAIVFQRQPGYEPLYEWVFYSWADIM